MDHLKLGIVGAGRLGSFHASKAAARNDVELIGVFDVNRSGAEKLAEKYRCRVFDSLTALAEEIQAAVVAVPSVLHFETASFLLKKQISLLIEKPMTTTASDAKLLLELAEKNNSQMTVGHTEEYNPAWITAKSLIQSGVPCLIDARRASGYTFRSTDIGVVLDLMIHDLELILSVVPSKILKIDAFGFSTIGGFEDFAQARLTFENGTVANLTASRIEHDAERVMKISSAYQTRIVNFATRTIRSIHASDDVKAGRFLPDHVSPEMSAEIQPDFMAENFPFSELTYDSCDALAEEMADFANVILHRQKSNVPASQAAYALEVAEKILKLI
ncbi:MAG: Gfo/Idh/MocA family oxidoreductase [Planctomycetaceae bacterium]|jgi:predicted dehydrogenase|nr:Gfo/Idh/MocA family oxidoreductase [Planctomycetaceae bacterium]